MTLNGPGGDIKLPTDPSTAGGPGGALMEVVGGPVMDVDGGHLLVEVLGGQVENVLGGPGGPGTCN